MVAKQATSTAFAAVKPAMERLWPNKAYDGKISGRESFKGIPQTVASTGKGRCSVQCANVNRNTGRRRFVLDPSNQ